MKLQYCMTFILGFGLALCAAAMPVHAQSTGAGVVKLPQDIEFKGPLTGPPQTVVCMAIRQNPAYSSRA